MGSFYKVQEKWEILDVIKNMVVCVIVCEKHCMKWY